MSAHSGRDSVVDLLLESPERIEQGFTVLDTRLRLDDQVEVDALLRDLLGAPVAVLLVRGDVAPELARIAGVVSALQRGRHLLARLYGDRGLDATARPRFVLLAPRFPDATPALLDMLAGLEVMACEYRVVTTAGRPVLDLGVFHRTRSPALAAAAPAAPSAPAAAPAGATSAPAPAPAPAPHAPAPQAAPLAPASPAAASPPAPASARAAPGRARTAAARLAGRGPADDGLDDTPAAPDDARRWFLRARESIRALSSHVTESQRDGHVHYRVKDDLLATLTLDQRGFRLQCGDGAEQPVGDEEALNRGLNSVFELYFNQLGPDRPLA